MTLDPNQRNELYNLLDLLFDEQLDDASQERLSRLLADCEEARWIYIAELNLHANLAWDWGVLKACDEREDALATSVPIPPIVLQPVPASHPSAFSLDAPLGGTLFSYAVSALLVCLGMFFGWAWKVSEPEQFVLNDPPVLTAASPFPPKMAIVGRITGMVDCAFSEDRDILPPPGNNAFVPLGRKYKLDSGLMEISYNTGAKVILQGPMTFEVESAAGGYLSVGRLTAKVEKNDERGMRNDELRRQRSDIHPSSFNNHPLFFVRTPSAVVADLGTEFGVDVDRSGLTSSHVFRGKVAISAVSEGGDKQGGEMVLGENESVRVEKQPGGGKIVVRRGDSRPGDFVRSEQFAAKAKEAKELPWKPFHRWKAFSEELRKRDDLLAYYDFQRNPNERRDATNSEVLRNRAKTGRKYDGQLRGAVQWAQGRFTGKHSLRSGYSDDDGVHINIPDPCRQMTLAAWINVDRFSRGYTALIMSDGWNKPGDLHCQFLADGRIKWDISGSPQHYGGTSPPFFNKESLGRWHFVAVVCDLTSGRLAFYLDGELLSEHSMGIAPPDVFVRLGSSMISAWEPLEISLIRDRRFDGRMDELMIFRSALSGEEIKKIYEGTKEILH